ncbi:hypothetical protein MUGA111182_04965 [Mucilaginibacter galii]|uniref:Uncharacterized protein n=1 Tax=Mucilaginibacter galii TaxID=2005073 RepID=A0A917J810_9SPHI|nr:hypothetical protein [Mucilaginibacter galii]GGI49812.1 hypothetical protein GCM10011425_10240 [Mucilaginibacter galii]
MKGSGGKVRVTTFILTRWATNYDPLVSKVHITGTSIWTVMKIIIAMLANDEALKLAITNFTENNPCEQEKTGKTTCILTIENIAKTI